MKLPYVLVLLAATLSFMSFAQERSVVAHFMDDKGNCDRQLKLIILKDATTDSTIWSITDSICDLNIPLSYSVSSYLLKIKTAEGFLVERSFQFSDSSAIDLGSISMYPIAKEIEDVTITGVQKKFIVVDAEKTTITVEGNAVLEVSSIYDAILKIPGILPFPGGGFAMSGQLASVYFEGIPSTLGTSDLENLLKSLPATSVQKIELISNPGASYDATTTGAIIDIISQGRVTKWISGTVTLNSGFNVNQKLMPSLMLSGRGKKYTWQLSTGYTYFKKDYRETYNRQYNYFDTATSFLATRREFTNDQNVYFRPSLTYRINKNSFLQVNLGATIFRNKIKGNATNEVQSDQSLTNFNRKGSGNQVSAGLKYRLFLDTLKRKMEITVNVNRYDYFSNRLTTQEFYGKSYSLIQNSNLNNSFFIRGDFEIPLPKLKSQINLGAKYSYFDALSSGNYNLNDTLELTLESRNFSSTIPFKYREQNQAVYGEWKQKIGKNISVTAGLRVENFTLNGKLLDSTVVERQYFNLFPSVHALYKIADPIILTANYSRKINMPNYSQFDPNLNGYYDNFTSSSGNPALSPNFSHRAGAKLTIFDYLELSATYNLSNSTNLSEVTADSNSFVINQTYRTYKNVGTVSYFMAIPVPFGMFKSGLDFFNQAIDVDAISFMYIYADRNKTTIPNYNYVNGNNPWWSFGFYSQVMLPYKIRLNIEYDYTAKGMYFISETTKGIHDMEIVVSREFKDDRWRASISVQDVFNSYAEYGRTSYLPLTLSSYSKADTRAVWFKLSYSFGRYERPSADDDSGIPSKGDK